MDNPPLENPFSSIPAPAQPSGIRPELTYEETPVIEPVAEPAPQQQPQQPVPEILTHPVETPPVAQPMPQKPLPYVPPPQPSLSPIALFFILALLFGAGVSLSYFVRQFFSQFVPAQKLSVVAPTTIPTATPAPYENWKTYFIISGTTRKPIDGVSFKLPPDLAELFCDGPSCSSQGTYLQGKTRFTVAARGPGQTLADYRGKIVTDFGGHPFTTTPTTGVGRPGVTYVGDFTGTTVTGYTFTKMRGAMISVTDTLSLEVNHFTPIGVTDADFAADDVLFTKILDSFVFAGLPMSAVTAAPTLIPSGY